MATAVHYTTELRKRMLQDLQLAGLSERTQEAYLRSVRQLANHVHYVVPGGGLSHEGDRRLPSRADFFVPAKALSVVFRAKFRDILRREGLLG
jgi:Putative transposase